MKRYVFLLVMFFATLMETKATLINDINYLLDIDNGVAEVQDIISVAEKLTIPDTVEYYGYKFAVKRINRILNAKVKELTLPNTLRDTIRYGMLLNPILEKVYCPPHITKMDSAFMHCPSLKEVILPDSLKTANYLFYGCEELRSCNLPINVETLYYTFYNCRKLESVNLPEKIKYIKDESFYDCYELNEIIIPNSVEIISRSAFSSTRIKRINIPESLDISLHNKYLFLNMPYLEEIVVSPNDKKFVTVDGGIYAITSDYYDLWWHNGIDEDICRLPNFNRIKIDDDALCEKISIIEIPKECKEFRYYCEEGPYKSYLQKIIVEEGGDTLSMRVEAVRPFSLNAIHLGRYVKPLEGFDYVFFIKGSIYERGEPNVDLHLSKNTGDIEIEHLFEPYSYYTWSPYHMWIYGYAPRFLVIEDGTKNFIPDFSVEFMRPQEGSDYKILENVERVINHCVSPPECENRNGLTSINATLYVPKGTWVAYATHPFWKLFKDIQEMENGTGVDDALINGSNSGAVEVERYDVNGRLLSKPTWGLNVVKLSNGKVKKEFVR